MRTLVLAGFAFACGGGGGEPTTAVHAEAAMRSAYVSLIELGRGPANALRASGTPLTEASGDCWRIAFADGATADAFDGTVTVEGCRVAYTDLQGDWVTTLDGTLELAFTRPDADTARYTSTGRLTVVDQGHELGVTELFVGTWTNAYCYDAQVETDEGTVQIRTHDDGQLVACNGR